MTEAQDDAVDRLAFCKDCATETGFPEQAPPGLTLEQLKMWNIARNDRVFESL